MTHDYDVDARQREAEQIKQAQVVPALLGLIHPSPTNPRKHFPEDEQADMTASVRKHGILQPILVRLWPVDQPWQSEVMPTYEIVAGERRYRAAVAAGLTVVPTLVRTLTDLEVLEIQIIENLQRQDLHPLEEAEGYQRMITQHGYTAEQLGEKIGKSKAYIYARIKLSALTEEGKRLFYAGLLNPSTALLVARIPVPKLQDQAIADITRTHYGNDPMSFRSAKQHVRDRYMLKLAQAPFPRGDRTLVPDAGRCHDCQYRTGNQPELYEDIDSADVCTHPECFTAKKLAYVARQKTEAEAKGMVVITGQAAKKIAPYGISDYGQTEGNFTRLDAKCYADPEQRTYRELLGEAAPVTLVEDVTKHNLIPMVETKVLAQKLKEAGIETNEAKAKAKNEKEQAKVKLENAFRARLFANIRAEASNLTGDTGPVLEPGAYTPLLRLLADQAFHRAWDDSRKKVAKLWNVEGKNDSERVEAFRSHIAHLDARDCWILMMDLAVVSQLTADAWSMEHHQPEHLLGLAEIFGVDPDDIRKDVEAEAREKAKPPRKAAQAPEKKATKKAAPATENKPAKKAGKTKAIEMNEKPADAEPKVGDDVRIGNDLRGPDGKRRKCCGREGTIEGIDGDGAYYTVRIGPKPRDVVNLVWNEFQVLPATGAAAIETHEKPAEDPAPARCPNTPDMLEDLPCAA